MDTFWDDKVVIGKVLYVLDKNDYRHSYYVSAQTDFIHDYVYRIRILKDCGPDYELDCSMFPEIVHLDFGYKDYKGVIKGLKQEEVTFLSGIPENIRKKIPLGKIQYSMLYGKITMIVKSKYICA